MNATQKLESASPIYRMIVSVIQSQLLVDVTTRMVLLGPSQWLNLQHDLYAIVGPNGLAGSTVAANGDIMIDIMVDESLAPIRPMRHDGVAIKFTKHQ